VSSYVSKMPGAPSIAGIATASDRELWHMATYDLLHRTGGAIAYSADFLRDHPAMQELMRRERVSAGPSTV
jgi:hypothetical protein